MKTLRRWWRQWKARRDYVDITRMESQVTIVPGPRFIIEKGGATSFATTTDEPMSTATDGKPHSDHGVFIYDCCGRCGHPESKHDLFESKACTAKGCQCDTFSPYQKIFI